MRCFVNIDGKWEMDKSAHYIVSKTRKVVGHVFRKRKRTRLPKCSSKETAFSVNALPPKLKRSSSDNVDVRSELKSTDGSKLVNDSTISCETDVQSYWRGRETRSLEDLHISRTTAKKMVELQLENDELRREVRDLDKKLKDLNRQLKQEREFYEEQRWAYVQEIRATIKDTSNASTQTREYIDSDDDDDDDTLAHELRRVREMFYKQRDVSCRLSEKFLQMRNDRNRLQARLKRLEMVYSTVIDELLKHIAEVRVYFASIKKGVLLERSAVASLVDRNAKLGYNNAILQLEILKYEKKLETYQTQTIDCTDGSEVEKFMARCRSSKLLAISGGGDASSVKLTRKGSFINVPVAVINGDRIETKLAPLFSIVGLKINHDSRENQWRNRSSFKAKTPSNRRRTRSVPSKVWRVKYEMKPTASLMRNRRIISEPVLVKKNVEVEAEDSGNENSDGSSSESNHSN